MVTISTRDKRQIIDITARVEQEVKGDGLVCLFVPHTTAAVTVADLDPGTDLDILDALDSMTPDRPWRHPHDPEHFPDHLWAAILGPGLILPCQSGKLQLGSWQRVVLVELDGPRDREVIVRQLPALEHGAGGRADPNQA